jgi:peptide/nickel transport system permease protein
MRECDGALLVSRIRQAPTAMRNDRIGEPPSHGPWPRALRRFVRQRSGIAALFVLLVVLIAGALAARIAPYDFSTLDLTRMFSPPSWKHLFGTDLVGRETFSRTLFGIQTDEWLALQVTVGTTVIGVIVGAAAGYYGGWADSIIMRTTEFVGVFPPLALLFAAITILGAPSPHMLREVLVFYMWTPVARVVRSSVLVLREREFVEAARASGASDVRIIVRHLLPNAVGSAIVATSLVFGQVILLEATVGYFNYGINEGVVPTLGNLIASGVSQGVSLDRYWWLWVFPGLVLVVMLVCVNAVADSLDDALNPSAVSGRWLSPNGFLGLGRRSQHLRAARREASRQR